MSPILALRKYKSCSRLVDEFLFLKYFQNGTSSKLISRERSLHKLVLALVLIRNNLNIRNIKLREKGKKVIVNLIDDASKATLGGDVRDILDQA